MNIKPGNLFEWVYKHNNESVVQDTKLYSYVMEKYIPCNGLCLCVGIKQNVIYSISDAVFFFADIHAYARPEWGCRGALLIPRKIKL
jgi:hypothetical protein